MVLKEKCVIPDIEILAELLWDANAATLSCINGETGWDSWENMDRSDRHFKMQQKFYREYAKSIKKALETGQRIPRNLIKTDALK